MKPHVLSSQRNEEDSSSRVLYSVTLTPGRHKFHCYSLDTKSSAFCFGKSRSLMKSLNSALFSLCGVHSNLLPLNQGHGMSQGLTIPVKCLSIYEKGKGKV
ncbi:hypothetical protein TNIN_100001 [Trichonephila inaurata madagascariensis]|uniref:Uncharacterized protein n=1 Tax=Trichonephila inaurata madagascariensis TaxID=2747483 RepID=A0A8X6Y1C0_9ARAC|nr:hypothetical protein TNIN_86701 [Trichonephila inaurata madagascariensis]GFY76851.1 hypothetical protein TNIN_100001 [Trichonephila inaurata madagascariensis]